MIEYRIIGRVVSHDTKSHKNKSEGEDRVLATFETKSGANIFMGTLSDLQHRADKRPAGMRD